MFETALMSIISGGATGLLGSVFSHVTDYFKTKLQIQQEAQKHAHEKEMRALDLEQTKLEIAGRAQIAQTEAQAAVDVAAFKALSDSFGNDKATYATGEKAKNSPWFVFVDVFRGITRPGVTWYMAALVTYMFIAFLSAIGGLDQALTKDQVAQIIRDIVATVLYVSTCVTLWWFGTRPGAKK